MPYFKAKLAYYHTLGMQGQTRETTLEVVQGSKTRYLFHTAPTKDAL